LVGSRISEKWRPITRGLLTDGGRDVASKVDGRGREHAKDRPDAVAVVLGARPLEVPAADAAELARGTLAGRLAPPVAGSLDAVVIDATNVVGVLVLDRLRAGALVEIELDHRRELGDLGWARLPHLELDRHLQGHSHLHGTAEAGADRHHDANGMLRDQAGISVQRRELDAGIAHDELDRNSVAPVGERVDIARQVIELHADDLGIRHAQARAHDAGRTPASHDHSATPIRGQGLHRDVVDHALDGPSGH
jgi:hypothetical protein